MRKRNNFELLNRINSPQDLKKLDIQGLKVLADEIRQFIISVVSRTGGHLSSNLGSVELTLALHYVFDSPKDIFIWDVGHQCYTHKIITGRKDRFHTLRQFGGISGFPNPKESPHDHFIVGHGSTAISQALGLATARDLLNEDRKVIAIVGDGSLVGGMAFEALNYLGHVQRGVLIVLNDNEWAISKTIGAISRYLNRIITNPLYNKVADELEKLLAKLPKGNFAVRTIRKLKESLKNLLVPGIIFEELGIKYVGPIDGHDLPQLISTFKNLRDYTRPVIVHVLTKKGKGYPPSEKEPDLFHSAKPFNISNGSFAKKGKKTYTDVFAQTIVDLGFSHPKLVAITAAMPHGTGLIKFKERFPDRFFDVGMAEQNAVTFAAGLSKGGFKPIIAIYSTFIQRAYDQIMHDVCLQNLPVIFCLDRAGIVGEDGPTHHGVFDISFLRHLPNIILMAPKDGWELKLMLNWMMEMNCPICIRYPKAQVPDLSGYGYEEIKLGKAEVLMEGEGLAVFAYGSMVEVGDGLSRSLINKGLKPYLVNLRFAKPLDYSLIEEIMRKVNLVITLEEGSILGGIGEAVASFANQRGLGAKVINFGIPDEFIPHGKREELLKYLGLDEEGIFQRIEPLLMEKICQG